MSNKLTDQDIEAIASAGVAWCSEETFALLIASMRLERRQRDEAVALIKFYRRVVKTKGASVSITTYIMLDASADAFLASVTSAAQDGDANEAKT